MSNNMAASLERLQEQTGGQVTDGVVGTFVREKVYSEPMSAAAGEPVYVIHDYCMIRVPGNAGANHKALVRKTFPDGREIMVSDYHANKFGKAWDAFLRGEDLRPVGTTLEDCPAIPRERIAAMKQAHIRTVEELVALPDASLRRIGHDARALQRAAQDWLSENDDQAKMAAELATLRAQVEVLQAAAAKPKRGKSAAAEGVTDGDNQANVAERGEYDRSSAAG